MATPTYEPIVSYTIPSNTTSVTLGSGGQGTIPSTYTDLILVIGNFGMSSGGSAARLRFNGDTGSNYSATWMGGYSTTTFTSADSNQTSMRIMGAAVGPGTANNDTATLHIQNYANTNVNKTVIVQGALGTEVYRLSGLWRSTAAVTSITLISYNGSDLIRAGTTLSLYGIANAAIGAPKATGGIITYDDTYFYHTFGASGTFTPQQSLTADVLVVAGGGGGGSGMGGGGGAGGYVYLASQSLSATGYSVTVGSGGPGNTSGSQGNGTAGGNSSFNSTTAIGGGYGGQNGPSGTGGNGGSGGGGGGGNNSPVTGGTATSGQGNIGGSSLQSGPNYPGGGGGGAGSAGSQGTSTSGGAGGNGLSTLSSWGLVTGTGQNVNGTVYYAAGGGGGTYEGGTNGVGGLGGGGNSGNPGTNGLVNTGSGGGGGNFVSTFRAAGNGGSGVVIVRYPK